MLSYTFFLPVFCHHSERHLSSFHLIFPILCLLWSYWCVHYFFYTPPFFSVEARSTLAFSGFVFLWYIRCWTTCQVICLTFRTLCYSAVILLSSADLTTLLRCSSTLLSGSSESLFVVRQTTLLGDTLIVLQSLKNDALLPEEIYALPRLYVYLNRFHAWFLIFIELCCIWHSYFAITSFHIVL
jgi:hypothetical protein